MAGMEVATYGTENSEKSNYEGDDDYEGITDARLWMVNEDLEMCSMAEKEIEMLKEQIVLNGEMIARSKQELAWRKEQIAKHQKQTAVHKEQTAKAKERIAEHQQQIAKYEQQIAKDKEHNAKRDVQIAKLKELLVLFNREKAKVTGESTGTQTVESKKD